nr:hypothetical protein [Cytophagales bacterium]
MSLYSFKRKISPDKPPREKKRIFIASVLKPTEDSRSFYKFGLSLRETNKYDVYILGFSKKIKAKKNNILLLSLFSKNRTHLSRIAAPFKLIRHIFNEKPDLIILTTYELAPAILFCKRFLTFKLIYDVQENYSLNVLTNKTLPGWLGRIAARWIRGWESRLDPHVDQYLFAEQCYQQEFPHISRYTVVENKYSGNVTSGPSLRFTPQKPIQFILAGTLTPTYGIVEGIRWFIAFDNTFPGQGLLVIGHCPLSDYRNTLEQAAAGHPRIALKVDSFPLPFEEISLAVAKADCWLMPYQPLPSLTAKIPTKLYESIAQRKVVVLPPNPTWMPIVGTYNAGIAVDFFQDTFSKEELSELYRNTFFTNTAGSGVFWSSEAPKLLAVVDSLLSE